METSNLTIEYFNKMNRGTMMETLGIEYLEVRQGYVLAKMPVGPNVLQPYGFLHGGASMAFAESVGGVGSAFLVGMDKYDIRGQHLSADHLHLAEAGTWVFAKATIIHAGCTTHVWNIDILNEKNQTVSSCRLTNFILPKKQVPIIK